MTKISFKKEFSMQRYEYNKCKRVFVEFFLFSLFLVIYLNFSNIFLFLKIFKDFLVIINNKK